MVKRHSNINKLFYVEQMKKIIIIWLLLGYVVFSQARGISLVQLPKTEKKNFSQEYWATLSAKLEMPLLTGNNGTAILHNLETAESMLNELAEAEYTSTKDQANVRLFLLDLLRKYTETPRYLELARSPQRIEIKQLGYPAGKYRKRTSGNYPFDRVINYPMIILRTLTCLRLTAEQVDECIGIIKAVMVRDIVEQYELGLLQFLLAFDGTNLESKLLSQLQFESEHNRTVLALCQIASYQKQHGISKALEHVAEIIRNYPLQTQEEFYRQVSNLTMGFGYRPTRIQGSELQTLFSRTDDTIQKLLLIRISLLFLQIEPPFDPTLFENYLQTIKNAPSGEKEVLLFQYADDACKLYRQR